LPGIRRRVTAPQQVGHAVPVARRRTRTRSRTRTVVLFGTLGTDTDRTDRQPRPHTTDGQSLLDAKDRVPVRRPRLHGGGELKVTDDDGQFLDGIQIPKATADLSNREPVIQLVTHKALHVGNVRIIQEVLLRQVRQRDAVLLLERRRQYLDTEIARAVDVFTALRQSVQVVTVVGGTTGAGFGFEKLQFELIETTRNRRQLVVRKDGRLCEIVQGVLTAQGRLLTFVVNPNLVRIDRSVPVAVVVVVVVVVVVIAVLRNGRSHTTTLLLSLWCEGLEESVCYFLEYLVVFFDGVDAVVIVVVMTIPVVL
jgi:hypothetical protein